LTEKSRSRVVWVQLRTPYDLADLAKRVIDDISEGPDSAYVLLIDLTPAIDPNYATLSIACPGLMEIRGSGDPDVYPGGDEAGEGKGDRVSPLGEQDPPLALWFMSGSSLNMNGGQSYDWGGES
jgi:hypothetical protein